MSAGGQLLQGEVVVVTGASRGVGAAIACAFARAGANRLILVSEQSSADELKQTQQKCQSEAKACQCECMACDLSNPKEVQALGEKLAGQGVTCLVNNAGIFTDGEDDPLKGNPDNWERMMKVNAQAPMRLIRALSPGMVQKGHGAIICIGDVEGWHSGPRHAAYAASKYALRGFCKSSYEALRGNGVRVMNVSAGNITDTAMAQGGKHGAQGALAPEDVAEACLLPWHCSANCVPEEIVLKAVLPSK